MFILTFSCVSVFGNTWTAWIAHFFFVMLVRGLAGSSPPIFVLGGGGVVF